MGRDDVGGLPRLYRAELTLWFEGAGAVRRSSANRGERGQAGIYEEADSQPGVATALASRAAFHRRQ